MWLLSCRAASLHHLWCIALTVALLISLLLQLQAVTKLLLMGSVLSCRAASLMVQKGRRRGLSASCKPAGRQVLAAQAAAPASL